MKNYTYSEKQVNQLLSYLGERPAKEVHALIQILFAPVTVTEVAEEQQQEEANEQGQEVRQG
jgi:hypothetical protein